jgi:glycosyltransferase involved in cell wall biosynthesis
MPNGPLRKHYLGTLDECRLELSSAAGVAGQKMPPTDSEAWRTAILSLRDDAALRARLGAVARARCAERYSWPTRAKRLLTFLVESKKAPAAESLPV